MRAQAAHRASASQIMSRQAKHASHRLSVSLIAVPPRTLRVSPRRRTITATLKRPLTAGHIQGRRAIKKYVKRSWPPTLNEPAATGHADRQTSFGFADQQSWLCVAGISSSFFTSSTILFVSQMPAFGGGGGGGGR